MSSTNRSKARETHIADYYRTPTDAIDLFLSEFSKHVDLDKNINILDPTSGGDAQHEMAYPTVLKQYGFKNIHTIDIREDSRADVKGDYLKLDCKDKYDLIITNPPFGLALEIINKAIDDVKDGGYVVMLLRLSYFESKIRKVLWDNYMAIYALVHSRRLAFSDSKKTDSDAYMHCIWKKGENPEFCMLKVI